MPNAASTPQMPEHRYRNAIKYLPSRQMDSGSDVDVCRAPPTKQKAARMEKCARRNSTMLAPAAAAGVADQTRPGRTRPDQARAGQEERPQALHNFDGGGSGCGCGCCAVPWGLVNTYKLDYTFIFTSMHETPPGRGRLNFCHELELLLLLLLGLNLIPEVSAAGAGEHTQSGRMRDVCLACFACFVHFHFQAALLVSLDTPEQ